MHELTTLVDLDPEVAIDDFAGCSIDLADVEVLVTAWGYPVLDEQAFTQMPRLRAMVHAAGSVKHLVTPAVWERKVRVTTGTALNASRSLSSRSGQCSGEASTYSHWRRTSAPSGPHGI